MAIFWILFVFMLFQMLYVTITMTTEYRLTWAKLGWFTLGFVDALGLGYLIGSMRL